jgi:hypothetical protein
LPARAVRELIGRDFDRMLGKLIAEPPGQLDQHQQVIPDAPFSDYFDRLVHLYWVGRVWPEISAEDGALVDQPVDSSHGVNEFDLDKSGLRLVANPSCGRTEKVIHGPIVQPRQCGI